jgi:hypothetical protein
VYTAPRPALESDLWRDGNKLLRPRDRSPPALKQAGAEASGIEQVLADPSLPKGRRGIRHPQHLGLKDEA